MITYTEIPTEVAKDIFNLTVALSKRNIWASINYSPLGGIMFAIQDSKTLKRVYYKYIYLHQDWTKEYELMSEEIKPIIEKLEEKK